MRNALLLLLFTGCATQKMMKQFEADGERLRFDLARTYVDKGAYVAALPLVQKSAAEHPNEPTIRTLHGVVLRERSLYPQAERELKAALQLKEDYAPAWAALGVLYDLSGRHDEALAAHRRSVELQPRDAAFWNNLGFSLYLSGRDDEAIEAFNKALGFDASMVVSYNNLGFTYARKKDFANARRCFEAAMGSMGELNLALAMEQYGGPEERDAAKALRAEARRFEREANR
jgi:Flp pilus assembly protein TadD